MLDLFHARRFPGVFGLFFIFVDNDLASPTRRNQDSESTRRVPLSELIPIFYVPGGDSSGKCFLSPIFFPVIYFIPDGDGSDIVFTFEHIIEQGSQVFQ